MAAVPKSKEPTLQQQLASLDVYGVVDRFLQSETEYTRKLRILYELHRRLDLHVKNREPIIDSEQVNAIFGNCSTLYGFTSSLSERLNVKRWESHDEALIALGDYLLKELPIFKVYAKYNGDLKSSLTTLEKLYNTNQKFKNFINFNEQFYDLIVNKQPGTNTPILGSAAQGVCQLLKYPQQHFPKYTIYLQSIVSAFAELDYAHPAQDNLEKAFASFLQIIGDIAQKAEERSRVERVMDIQQTYFKDSILLIDVSRRFYRCSQVRIKDGFQTIDCTLFLFNDILFYATAPSFGFGGWKLIDVMSTAGLRIEPSKLNKNTFRLISSITGQQWDVTTIPSKTLFDGTATEPAEKSYYQWLKELLTVYNIVYNLDPKAKSRSPPNITHPQDLSLILRKQPCPAPRSIAKPPVTDVKQITDEIQRITDSRSQKRGLRTAPQPVQQPGSSPAPPSTIKTSNGSTTTYSTTATTTATTNNNNNNTAAPVTRPGGVAAAAATFGGNTSTPARPAPIATPRRAPTAPNPNSWIKQPTTNTTPSSTVANSPFNNQKAPQPTSSGAAAAAATIAAVMGGATPVAPSRPSMSATTSPAANNNATTTNTTIPTKPSFAAPTLNVNTTTTTPSNTSAQFANTVTPRAAPRPGRPGAFNQAAAASSSTSTSATTTTAAATTTTTPTQTTTTAAAAAASPNNNIVNTTTTTTATPTVVTETQKPQQQKEPEVVVAPVVQQQPEPEPTLVVVAPTPAPVLEQIVEQPEPVEVSTPTVAVVAPTPVQQPQQQQQQQTRPANPLLGAIQSGAQLKKVEIVEPAARPKPQGGLFAQISSGVSLKKVTEEDKQATKQKAAGLTDDLANALDKYRRFVADDDEDGADSDDDDW